MKFYSEKLNQVFDTVEALEAEESKKSSKKRANVPVAEEAKKETELPSRKELADEVERADELVKDAYAQYESAKVKVEELSKKYLAEVEAILEPAQKAVKDAEKNRYDAIRRFNDSYGAYQVTYTGAKAADELIKAINNINGRANRLFRDIFWI